MGNKSKNSIVRMTAAELAAVFSANNLPEGTNIVAGPPPLEDETATATETLKKADKTENKKDTKLAEHSVETLAADEEKAKKKNEKVKGNSPKDTTETSVPVTLVAASFPETAITIPSMTVAAASEIKDALEPSEDTETAPPIVIVAAPAPDTTALIEKVTVPLVVAVTDKAAGGKAIFFEVPQNLAAPPPPTIEKFVVTENFTVAKPTEPIKGYETKIAKESKVEVIKVPAPITKAKPEETPAPITEPFIDVATTEETKDDVSTSKTPYNFKLKPSLRRAPREGSRSVTAKALGTTTVEEKASSKAEDFRIDVFQYLDPSPGSISEKHPNYWAYNFETCGKGRLWVVVKRFVDYWGHYQYLDDDIDVGWGGRGGSDENEGDWGAISVEFKTKMKKVSFET